MADVSRILLHLSQNTHTDLKLEGMPAVRLKR